MKTTKSGFGTRCLQRLPLFVALLNCPQALSVDITWTYFVSGAVLNYSSTNGGSMFSLGTADPAGVSLWAFPTGSGQVIGIWLDSNGREIHHDILPGEITINLLFDPIYVSTNRAVFFRQSINPTNFVTSYEAIEWTRLTNTIVKTSTAIQGIFPTYLFAAPVVGAYGFLSMEQVANGVNIHLYEYATPVTGQTVGSDFRLQWPSEADRNYTVQSSRDLLHWTNASVPLPGTSAVMSYDEPMQGSRSFRLKIDR